MRDWYTVVTSNAVAIAIFESPAARHPFTIFKPSITPATSSVTVKYVSLECLYEFLIISNSLTIDFVANSCRPPASASALSTVVRRGFTWQLTVA